MDIYEIGEKGGVWPMSNKMYTDVSITRKSDIVVTIGYKANSPFYKVETLKSSAIAEIKLQSYF